MKLTPLDIQQQQFRRTVWGSDNKEVDAFLDLVANAFEDLVRENNSLNDELRRKEHLLEDHRERERTLKETMITATKISEDIKQGAHKEAEIVISQAELQAEQIIQNAHTRLVRVMEDIDELKRQRAQFEGSLQSVIGSHQKLLEAMTEREAMTGELESMKPARRPIDFAAKNPRPKLATVPVRDDTPDRDAPEEAQGG